MFQAELVYSIQVGYQPLIATRNRISLLEAHVEDTVAALGFDVASDVTVVDGSEVRRNITLQTNSLGDLLWTTEAQVAAITTKLFRAVFAMLTPTRVTAADPVVTTI